MKPAEGQEDAVSGEASLWMVIPLCLTALLAIVFGLLPNLPIAFFDLAKVVVDSVFDMGGVSPQPN